MSQMLTFPAETADWLIVMEGYLASGAKKVKGPKVTYYVLKQSPDGSKAVIEQFSGRTFLATFNLSKASIALPDKSPTLFSLQLDDSLLKLKTDHPKVTQAWVVRLQQVINAIREGVKLTSSRQASSSALHGQQPVSPPPEPEPYGAETPAESTNTSLTRKDSLKLQTQRSNLMSTSFMSDLASKYSFINQ
ncbi:hypothetical protein PTSG_02260 [Salpingoeca rosetta]|uniref:PH domain-containing protein n=1 Tax=Salpingoeca rosetta (strain ATCC 50818 / BSB-021) TaxID=946362 RepID=F2U1P0_SALR5|nr:uncharacterized protein PTSG_02260 [Salpingoeca rosetta]EGD81542.1 hypothetical protein PTSG_02260 [Salpingoeca rosetta]|eukprot:XP_004996746.1 hypothetical protein PTSG_02260 [Salpingoeca rosetta]